MNIIEAGAVLKRGQEVSRNLWKSDYLFYNDKLEMIFIGGGRNPDYGWVPTLEDFLADDYEVVGMVE